MTKLIKYILVIATVSPCRCFAQKLLINYTTELQSDFKKGTNWVNLLRLDFSAPLGPSATLEAATLSTAKTRAESLANDCRPFPTSKKTIIRWPWPYWASGSQWEIPACSSASVT